MPRPSHNTIGLKFDRLLVVGQYLKKIGSEKHQRMMCLCLCDCQKDLEDPIFVEVRQGCLLNGNTKSCGCLNEETKIRVNSKDLSNQKLGRLLVIKRIPKQESGLNETAYLCKCDCGNETIVKRSFLTTSPTPSCGCFNIDSLSERKSKDLTWQKFGRLLTIKRIPPDRVKHKIARYVCLCECGNVTIVETNNLTSGTTKSCRCYAREVTIERNSGPNSPMWKGGVKKNKIALYDTYSPQLEPMEETRRDPDNYDLLQCKCTKCMTWFTPKLSQVQARVRAMIGTVSGESRFYCSNECKNSCILYGAKPYHRSSENTSNRPYIDPYWREQVLSNADYKCEICGSENDLEAHHIQSATLNPMFANDLDNGICLCSQCHDNIHHQSGCTTWDLRCNPNSPE